MKSNRSAFFWLKVLFVLFTVSLFFALLGILNRTGGFILFWQQDELTGIRHDSGFAYYAMVPNENTAALNLPVYLVEGERILSAPVLAVNQDLSRDIKEQGGGLFRLLENNNLYFSSTDHTDPTAGQKTYSVLTPVIIRMRHLLPVLAVSLGLGLLLGMIRLIGKLRSDQELIGRFRVYFKNTLLAFSVLVSFLLLLPAQRLSGPPAISGSSLHWEWPLLQRNAVFLLILMICVICLYRFTVRPRVLYGLLGLIWVLNTGYYFWPEKDYYGVRTDSASYLLPYDAQSIRTPAYPRFIEDVMTLVPGSDLDYWRSAEGQEMLADRADLLFQDVSGDSRGLVQVVRAQKIFLGVSFLVTAGLLCFLISPCFVFLFGEFALALNFLGVYNNYILSEVLSQAMLLLCCGIFCYFVARKVAWAFPFLCFFCAVSVLVRPANVFVFMLPAFAVIWLIFRQKRSAAGPLFIGLLIAAGLVLIPASVVYRATGYWIWMPNEGYAGIGHALALMQPEDIERQEDAETRKFLEASYDRIAQMKKENALLTQNDYVFGVAVAEAEALGYDAVTANVLFSRASASILRSHSSDMLDILRSQFQTAVERTRLQTVRLSYWMILALAAVLSLIRCSEISLTGLLFILLHNVHLLISVTNQPERRYIWSTEIFFLLGAGLILYNLFRFPVKKLKAVHPDIRSGIPG